MLEAIEEDKLQQHALEVGTYLIQQLQALQKVDIQCSTQLELQALQLEKSRNCMMQLTCIVYEPYVRTHLYDAVRVSQSTCTLNSSFLADVVSWRHTHPEHFLNSS